MRRSLHSLRRAVVRASAAGYPASHVAGFSSSASAVAAAATSSSSAACARRLLLGLLIGGGGLIGGASLLTASTLSAEAAVVPQAAGSAAAGSPAKQPKAPIHPSDMVAIDFRTIGACPCPALPERAPRWLQELAKDEGFQYRDLTALLDTSGHFLLDALEGDRRLSESYYFTEKVEQPRPADGEEHPHLAPSLAFTPATGKVEKPVVEGKPKTPELKPTAPASPKAATPAGAAPGAAAPASAFSTFTTAPPQVMHATGPEVRAVFHVGKALCGHRGIVHGGLTAALMDDVSGAATFVAAGGGQFTANLTINYMKPVRADRYVLVRAQAVKQEGRKTYVNISVEDGMGAVFARGTALYVKPKNLPAAVMLAATH